MELTKKKATLYGGREIAILCPHEVDRNIAAGHDNKGNALIWGNGNAYRFLSQCLAVAAELQNNELLYIPVQFEASEDFRYIFDGCDYSLNIVCTNYCETPISIKDIERALQIKGCEEQIISRTATVNCEYIERWKTERRLTVKTHRKYIYIATNRDGFLSLSQGAHRMRAHDDANSYDGFLPHIHFDWEENTSVSLGVTLYYWSNSWKIKI